MFIVYWILLLYARTWRIQIAPSLIKAIDNGQPIAFWHGTLGILACRLPTNNSIAIVSPSSDGNRLSHFLKYRGFGLIRGSPFKNGKDAQRIAIQEAERGSAILYAVDGSRGPKGVPKNGVFALAAHLDKPVCFVLIRCDSYRSFSSWDSFVFPKLRANVQLIAQEILVDNIEDARAKMMACCHPDRFPLVD
jgi:lysophospholipid acyltransferase (LPLAT)-like uncharacterized protein